MSSPRRLPLAAALVAFAVAAGASGSASAATTCPAGTANSNVPVSTTGTPPNPARAGELQLCGVTPLEASSNVATTKTWAVGSLPVNSTYDLVVGPPLNLNIHIPVFQLGKATIDWGDGTAVTPNVTPNLLTGAISSAHTYATVASPTVYTMK